MKEKLTDEIRGIFANARNWLKLETEYVKLTAAEKFTILLGAMVMGFVMLLMGVVVLVLLALSLVHVFQGFMSPQLAYLSVAGVIVVLVAILYLLRKRVLLNPIARFVTGLILDKK